MENELNQVNFLEECLGQRIKIFFLAEEDPLKARLLWFDSETLGVRMDNSSEILIFKHAIVLIKKL